ncbi:hypothetical protein GTY81_19905 [Streptomyces sp. SID8366]|uniref:transposase n=1 Tax=unclassified Streptomyces TaxID=2593676 RepID=UPI000DC5B347|nr:transposase [Streptomyces sp. PsTaAH-130]MYU06101.1 hypothetical protein [Streptomyces sp. SID8366]MYU61674.1 hypothetical protein [Streptomyces sp. SID69]RAJ64169.1 hypothetical protein K376_01266 [Streptomyces sp. PsTaAH-130]
MAEDRNAELVALARQAMAAAGGLQLSSGWAISAGGARVTAATNKVGAFNGFSDWVRLGQNGKVTANDRSSRRRT